MNSFVNRITAAPLSCLSPDLIKQLSLHQPQLKEVHQPFPSPDAPNGKLIGHQIVFDQLPKPLFGELADAIYREYGQHLRADDAIQNPRTREHYAEPGFSETYKDIVFNISIRGNAPVRDMATALGMEIPSATISR